MTIGCIAGGGLVACRALVTALLIAAVQSGAQAAATLTNLHSFPSYSGDGQNPLSVAVGSNGSIYGVTQAGGTGVCYSVTFGGSGCGTIFELTPPAVEGGVWNETVLYSFTDENGDGAFPNGGVVVGANGEIYGTTQLGGSAGYGAVFELLPPAAAGSPWTEQAIYSFGAVQGYGQVPQGVIAGPNGVLYGTTAEGGAGFGSIYELTPPATPGGVWSEADIYSFAGGISEYPNGDLTLGPSGAVYGTTESGDIVSGYGTVFELKPPAAAGDAWTFSNLHTFRGGKGDGSYPQVGVVIGKGGLVYGATELGGSSGNGTVFELQPPGAPGAHWTETLLYSFLGASNGADPGALILAKNGTLLGVTEGGGDLNCDPHQAPGGCGIVFELTSGAGAWTQSVLHTFTGPDGAQPNGLLARGPDGAFFGTTYLGGTNAACEPVSASYPCGTVFLLRP